MKKIVCLLLCATFNFTSTSCERLVGCTREFRTVAVEITGPNLDRYYTLNRATGDTIRIDQNNVPLEGVYPVLDDTYQANLEGRTEDFRFEGWINDSLVVQADYVIAADQCHIDYVSGPLEIKL